MISRFLVVEPFKHGGGQYQPGDVLSRPADMSPVEAAALHDAGFISDASPENPLSDKAIVRDRKHIVDPTSTRAASNVEDAK